MTEIGHGSMSAILTPRRRIFHKTMHLKFTPLSKRPGRISGQRRLYGKAAVVFAQLITNNVNYGVHAFFVPLRDDDGNFLPGVGGEDDGYKGGSMASIMVDCISPT